MIDRKEILSLVNQEEQTTTARAFLKLKGYYWLPVKPEDIYPDDIVMVFAGDGKGMSSTIVRVKKISLTLEQEYVELLDDCNIPYKTTRKRQKVNIQSDKAIRTETAFIKSSEDIEAAYEIETYIDEVMWYGSDSRG